MQFSTRVTIDAPAAQVWSILTDLPSWPSWNTTVSSTQGTLALGEKVTVAVTAAPRRSFPVTVAELDEPRRMVWRGGLPLGLFTGTRTYTLSHEDGRTTFAMDEVYSGPLAPMLTRSVPDLQPAFDEFARCLKSHAESTT